MEASDNGIEGQNHQDKNGVPSILNSEFPRGNSRNIYFIFLALILTMAVLSVAQSDIAGQDDRPGQRSAVTNSQGPHYGVDFITSAEHHADEQQFANGLATGAGWDRWPVYWFYIETSEGVFDWSRQDTAVQADLDHGLQLNAILLGTPAFYTSNFLRQPLLPYQHTPRRGTLALDSVETARPQGLYEPVFIDGDNPGPDKVINPQNKWAFFVEAAVNRYKPGGLLAKSNGWPEGVGVTVWEMWNEPDLSFFWDASLQDYARLLKVGYLAAKHADPQAQVMFAGLAMWQQPDYYDLVLDVFDNDPIAADHGFFHDIMAVHNYSRSERSSDFVLTVGEAMTQHGLEKPIWLNESGVPAWDDYPGPVWEPLSPLRAKQQEQADFAIQSAFYAISAGADAIFHFQLYDGCGNQPQGTDFPPHNGELCDDNNNYDGKPCAGDANGLYRNPADATCFTQHPHPESPRPVFSAYKTLAAHVRDVQPYWRMRAGTPVSSSTCPGSDGPQEWIALYQPATEKRIVGLWARCGYTETAVIEATNPDGKAQLVAPDGSVQEITASGGFYSITLPAATNRNPSPGQIINPIYPIGGRPVILIETDTREEPPTSTPTHTPRATSTCWQGVLNGGFESDSGWRIPLTTNPASYSKELLRSGSRSMRAGIIDTQDNLYSYSTALQTVTLPKATTDADLHFWLYSLSSEPASLTLPSNPLGMTEKSAATTGDAQMVLILDSGGTIVEQLLYERRNDPQWREYSFDLSQYADKTIQIYFGVYNNGTGGISSMHVDDVSLSSCSAITPTATPSATPTSTPAETPAPNQLSFVFAPKISKEYPLGITGQIVDLQGQGIGNVTIRTDKGQSTVSEPDGWYALVPLDSGTYIIRPEKAGTVFSPQTREVILPPSAYDQDFVIVPPTPTPVPYSGP
jgi:hypothetical protein